MKIKGLRWWVVGLVVLAAIINYIDRQAFGALSPGTIDTPFHARIKATKPGIFKS